MVREQNGSRKSSGQAGAVQDCDGHALAPPAGKRKSTHQDATNLLVQLTLSPQSPQCSFMIIRASHVGRLEPPQKLSRWLKALT